MLQSLSISSPTSQIRGRPMSGSMSEARWYVVEAEQNQTFTAARSIIEKGFQSFLPTMAVRMRETIRGKRNGQLTVVHKPMFYQFLFTQFDVNNDNWQAIRFADGVKRLIITSKQLPVPVERGLVEGLIDTAPERLNLPETGLKRLKRDLVALIVKGPFQGHTGTVVACDGFITTLRLNILGGYRDVRVQRDCVSDE
ncbi:MAG TPA: transcription termination/antitermination NusG family protein [Halothiobacillus sp.]|nr:transcription termination/antitermination NusG family protein [Halothiobacillus sp.]